MIPAIEDILQMLLDGNINKKQALLWIDQHMENMADGAADLRDHFAGLAMQGICCSKDEAGTLVNHGYDWIASESYKIADAMLKARKA